MAEPEDLVLSILREMRQEISTGFGSVERRLDKLEATQASFKQALVGDSLLSKLVIGEFEQPIEALEERMRQFEGRS